MQYKESAEFAFDVMQNQWEYDKDRLKGVDKKKIRCIIPPGVYKIMHYTDRFGEEKVGTFRGITLECDESLAPLQCRFIIID